MTKEDNVKNPKHYTQGTIETWDFIADKKLNFNRGNVVKYVVRAGHKENELQDLEKAKAYLEKEIELLRKGGGKENGEEEGSRSRPRPRITVTVRTIGR